MRQWTWFYRLLPELPWPVSEGIIILAPLSYDIIAGGTGITGGPLGGGIDGDGLGGVTPGETGIPLFGGKPGTFFTIIVMHVSNSKAPTACHATAIMKSVFQSNTQFLFLFCFSDKGLGGTPIPGVDFFHRTSWPSSAHANQVIVSSHFCFTTPITSYVQSYQHHSPVTVATALLDTMFRHRMCRPKRLCHVLQHIVSSTLDGPWPLLSLLTGDIAIVTSDTAPDAPSKALCILQSCRLPHISHLYSLHFSCSLPFSQLLPSPLLPLSSPLALLGMFQQPRSLLFWPFYAIALFWSFIQQCLLYSSLHIEPIQRQRYFSLGLAQILYFSYQCLSLTTIVM